MKRHILSYIGGKSRFLKYLLPYTEVPHKCYVEVFGGAAHLLLAKKESKIEIYNDIDGDLVNLFEIARERPKELQGYLNLVPYARKIYEQWRKDWMKGYKGKNNLERAARFFFLVNSANVSILCNSMFLSSNVRNCASAYSSKIQNITEFAKRFRNVTIEQLDFEDCIKRFDSKDTLFYCDPPYFFSEEHYSSSFSYKDHIRLAKVLSNIEGKFFLTYYDTEIIRKLYENFFIEVIEHKKTSDRTKNKSGVRELIISNFSRRDVHGLTWFSEKKEASS